MSWSQYESSNKFTRDLNAFFDRRKKEGRPIPDEDKSPPAEPVQEKVSTYDRAYYKRNKERILENKRRWYRLKVQGK